MKPDPCPLCGKNRAVVGRMHHCVPSQAARLIDVANADSMANDMANDTSTPGRKRSSPTYRYRNPDKRRDYMAAYMRTYRKRSSARPAA